MIDESTQKDTFQEVSKENTREIHFTCSSISDLGDGPDLLGEYRGA